MSLNVLIIALIVYYLLLLITHTAFTIVMWAFDRIKGHVTLTVVATIAMPWLLIYGDVWDDPPPYLPKRYRWRERWRRARGNPASSTLLEAIAGQSRRLTESVLGAMATRCRNLVAKSLIVVGVDSVSNRAIDGSGNSITCVMTLQQHASQRNISGEGARYDSDSFLIVIDNACSFCITNNKQHFVGSPEAVNIQVRGIGGKQVKATLRGTVRWCIPNDEGEIHEELIPNTYYQEQAVYCLYSPQHVAQVANDNFPLPNGTYCATYADSVELFWDQRTEKRTVRLDPATNIAIMRSAPSFGRFHTFCAAINHEERGQERVAAQQGATVSDDEASDSEDDSKPSTSARPAARRHPDLPNEAFLPATSPINGADVHTIPTEDVDVQAAIP
jgi:hypothetical protein